MRTHKYRHHRVDKMNNIHEFEHELYKLHQIDKANTNIEFRKRLVKLLNYGIVNWLTGRQQQILTMYFIDNLKQREIARKLNINQSTVSRTITKAKKRLRKYCEPFFNILK